MKRFAPLAAALLLGCGEPSAAPKSSFALDSRVDSATSASPSTHAPTLSAEQLTCARDEGCAFDPVTRECGNDPRYNRQPNLVDQGVVCFCEQGHCGTLRVWPVPCESDASCAVRLAPRPHPVAASSTDLHERGKPCRDFKYSTTCERTNICTMHAPNCP